jgi:hypothetical protein
MTNPGPPLADSGEDPSRFEGEEHGWSPDVGQEGSEEGHEATKKSIQGGGKAEGQPQGQTQSSGE